jgi:hypothetical protein
MSWIGSFWNYANASAEVPVENNLRWRTLRRCSGVDNSGILEKHGLGFTLSSGAQRRIRHRLEKLITEREKKKNSSHDN